MAEDIKAIIETCKKNKQSDESNTYVPYYDSIIDKKQKGQLSHVKMNPLMKARLQQHNTLINIIHKTGNSAGAQEKVKKS